MSSAALPDEIIKEILTPALRVPDEIFRSTNDVSPFLNSSESSSAFLLVCKSWLRVATPLLYHVVVLRSKPQAKALERALRRNEILAAFIKKLRIEGAFGASMHHILRLGKNVEEVWLKLSIWSTDTVTGLCSGLPLVNPRSLILPDEYVNENAPTRKLVGIVCECITKWERLSVVDLPFHSLQTWKSFAQSSILNALSKAKSLKTITLTEPQFNKGLLLSLAKNPSLEVIHVLRGTQPGWNSHRNLGVKEFMADEKLGQLLQYDDDFIDSDDDADIGDDELLSTEEGNSSTQNLITFDSSFVALQSTAEEVRTEIWSNIIYFSLLRTDPAPVSRSVEREHLRAQSSFYSEVNPYPEYVPKIPKINILLVSKLFYNTAMRHYYRYCLLDGLSKASNIGHRISENTSFGSAIHHLATSSCWGGNAEYLRPFLANATNLVHLTSNKGDVREALLDYRSLVTLAAQSGSKLQTLTGHAIARPTSPQPPTPLYAFTSLRSLDWESNIRLKFKPKDVPVNALPSLEWLTFVSLNDTFLQLLECMTLPALKHVTFPLAKKMEGAREFLEKHGNKLHSLSMEDGDECWELCPSLSVMVMSGLPVFEPHAKVEVIILTISGFREGAVGDKFRALGTIDFGKDYPVLDEIRVHFCHWPTTERDIRTGPRSNWVKWSERLMEWNVKLTDKNGKHWKPRLK